MATLRIMRGIPGSGKSTRAREWVAESPETRARVNRDEIRLSQFGKAFGLTRDQENWVTEIKQATATILLKKGLDVVTDDTNLNAKFAKDWLKLAQKLGAEVEWDDALLDVPLQDCIAQDACRPVGGGQVGADVVKSFYNRYLGGGRHPKRPELDAEAPATAAPYSGTPDKQKTVLVDLDGTVAHNDGHRGFFEWHKVGADTPVEVIVELCQALWYDGYFLVFVSGREDVCYSETYQWIKTHIFDSIGKFDYNPKLFMRPEGDGRKDSVVKLEIFDNHIRDNYDVKFCLDDRNQVVEAYRSIGLTVLQVAPGDF